MTDKPRLVIVRDANLIEAIRRGDLFDPIGGCFEGVWYAYKWSVDRYKAAALLIFNNQQGDPT